MKTETAPQPQVTITTRQLTEAVIAMDYRAAELATTARSAEKEIDRFFAQRDLDRLEPIRASLRCLLPMLDAA